MPTPMPVPQPMPIVPRPPADPYNCAYGFANWVVGWLPRAEQGVLLSPPVLPMIAMQGLQIGWQDGVRLRRTGAARMLVRVAQQQLEVV